MNRLGSLAAIAFAGVIALGSASAQAAPAKGGAKATPQKSSQPAARVRAQRVPGAKPPPWYYPPGPTSGGGK